MTVYGCRSLNEFMKTGSTPKPEPVSDEVRAAWIIAKAIQPDLVDMYLTPLDVAEILANDKDLQTILQQQVQEDRQFTQQESDRVFAQAAAYARLARSGGRRTNALL